MGTVAASICCDECGQQSLFRRSIFGTLDLAFSVGTSAYYNCYTNEFISTRARVDHDQGVQEFLEFFFPKEKVRKYWTFAKKI